MFPPRIIGSIVACMLACGLLATVTSTAAARLPDDARTAAPTSSLAPTTWGIPCPPKLPDGSTTWCLAGTTETPRQDLRSPDARDAADADRIARMMEQFHGSFDKPLPAAPYYPSPSEPKPPTAPGKVSAPAPASDNSPWLLVSAISAALAVVLASTALVLRRRRTPAV